MSRFAHDLRLSVKRHAVTYQPSAPGQLLGEPRHGPHVAGRVRAEFWTGSLRVDGVVRSDGELDMEALSDSDRAAILAHVRNDILMTDRFPTALFEADVRIDDDAHVADLQSTALAATTAELDGTLTLCGRSVPVSFTVEVERGRARGHAVLTPSDWGIRPFRAMLGAIRLQDKVALRFDLGISRTP